MSRFIHSHKVNGLNEAIEISVGLDGPGGASHQYNVIGFGENIPNIGPRPFGVNIRFQNGPIATEKDFNGITNEALLAVLIDRMQGFQGELPHQKEQMSAATTHLAERPPVAPFRCRENAIALTHLEEALMWLQKRTRERMARNVEGKLEK